MQDEEFLSQFENCTLPKEYFKHKNHLRIAWLYLIKYDLNQAIDKVTAGILRYATSLGAAVIYHETLTRAWIHLVNQAMRQDGHGKTGGNFEQFITQHAYLLDKTLPNQFYSSKQLDSEQARRSWVEPDLKPFYT